MLVLMENPKHGRMHVYSSTELEAAKLHGWTVVVEPKDEVKEEIKVESKPKKIGK